MALDFKRKLLLFVGFNLVLLCGELAMFKAVQYGRFPGNSETESDLMIIPAAKRFDLVILGTSHGRIFARDNNHDQVQTLLERKVLNLSKGSGAGIMPMRLFLSCFFEKKNKANAIVYFLDPWVFYSASWNENNICGIEEPLRLDFLMKMARFGFSRDAISSYVVYKFQHQIVNSKIAGRPPKDGNFSGLERVNPVSVGKSLQILYPDGLDSTRCLKYRRELEELVSMAEAHGSKVLFATPATLLGNIPGLPEMKAFLADLKTRHPIEYQDFTYSIQDPKFFYDHDHLNTPGIRLFTSQFLKPYLDAHAPPGNLRVSGLSEYPEP